MSDKINVFVKLDFNGAGSKSFHVAKSTTIGGLKKMIDDREGVEVDILNFRTKPTQDHQTLIDLNCYNNCTFFASLRVLGGASEGNKGTQFDQYEVAKIAAKFGASVVTQNCAIGGSSGCMESMVKKCKFSCGCIFCADCMKRNINIQLNCGGVTSLFCQSSDCGSKAGGTSKGVGIDRTLAFAVCAYTDNEKAEKDQKMDENAFLLSTSEMSICPNSACKKFMIKKRNDYTLVEKCVHCNTEMCWVCKQPKHIDPLDCAPIANIIVLINSGDHVSVDGVNNVWSKRVCPSKTCHAVNKHKSACRHMTCKCGYQYCHVCLRKWSDHGPRTTDPQCILKGKETPTAKSLFYD